MNAIIHRRLADAAQAPAEWGCLTWFASGPLGNSAAQTVGRCVLKPGCGNPRHLHPNCEEVLVVLSGRIRHTVAGGEAELGPGDSVTIPPGIPHQAVNIGEGEAALLICFSSADRRVQGEEPTR